MKNKNMTGSNMTILCEMGFRQHPENERCFWHDSNCRVLFIEDCDEIFVEKKSIGVKRWGGWRKWRMNSFLEVLTLLEQLNVK